ncbi:unnamed protein product [Allacma fusca]|uniref:Uncharacterized protein n=1 Tax=Allacma fusca TaxID=39272 RepID=A0A8J2K7F6_9HEXA|nr:unnamed protein product [Allacma fusca]
MIPCTRAVNQRLCTFPPPQTTPKAPLGPADIEAETTPIAFSDLIPAPNLYDKMRPPKRQGEPTTVGFHVTVMGLDSINEYSMLTSCVGNH